MEKPFRKNRERVSENKLNKGINSQGGSRGGGGLPELKDLGNRATGAPRQGEKILYKN